MKRKTSTVKINRPDVIDCDEIYGPYTSGEFIDSLVAKDEIDLAVEIDRTSNEKDVVGVIESVKNTEEEVLNKGDNSQVEVIIIEPAGGENDQIKEILPNVTGQCEGVKCEKKVKSKKRKKRKKVASKENVGSKCNLNKVTSIATKVTSFSKQFLGCMSPCSVVIEDIREKREISRVVLEDIRGKKEISQLDAKNMNTKRDFVDLTEEESPALNTIKVETTSCQTTNEEHIPIEKNIQAIENVEKENGACVLERSDKLAQNKDDEVSINYDSTPLEVKKEVRNDEVLPILPVWKESAQGDIKTSPLEVKKEVRNDNLFPITPVGKESAQGGIKMTPLVVKKEVRNDVIKISPVGKESVQEDIKTSPLEVKKEVKNNIIISVSPVKVQTGICTADTRETMRKPAKQVTGRRYFTDVRALPQKVKIEETAVDIVETVTSKSVDDFSTLDMEISEEEEQPIMVEDVVLQAPTVQTTFQYSVLGRISECKDVSPVEPKSNEVFSGGDVSVNSESDRKTKSDTDDSTGKKKKKKKHKHKSKHKKLKKEKRKNAQVTTTEAKKSKGEVGCINMDIDPVIELEEIVNEKEKEKEKEKDKNENVKLFLSIKLLTKEKLTCEDPEKLKVLTDALDKLEKLISLQKEKESNDECVSIPSSPVVSKQDGASTVTVSAISCDQSIEMTDVQKIHESKASPLPDPRGNLLSPPQTPQPVGVSPTSPSTSPLSVARPTNPSTSPLPAARPTNSSTSPLSTERTTNLSNSSPIPVARPSPNLNLPTPPTPPTSVTPPRFPLKLSAITDFDDSNSDCSRIDSPLFDSIFNFQSPDSEKPSPVAGRSSSFSGDVRHDVLPHTHQDGYVCIDMCRDARAEPSDAYFKFPHRHSDGLLCQTQCQRLIYRERWKKEELLAKLPKPMMQPASIPWRLIPIDIPLTRAEKAALLVGPRIKEEAKVKTPGNDCKVALANKSAYLGRMTSGSDIHDSDSARLSDIECKVNTKNGLNPSLGSGAPPITGYGNQKHVPSAVTGNPSLVTGVTDIPCMASLIHLNTPGILQMSASNESLAVDTSPSSVESNSNNINLTAPKNLSTEGKNFPMNRSDVELVIRTFEDRIHTIGPVTPTIDEPITLAPPIVTPRNNQVLNNCPISAPICEPIGCSVGVLHAEPVICVPSTNIDNPIQRRREGTPTLDEPLLTSSTTHMATTVGACTSRNELVGGEVNRTLLLSDTDECPPPPPPLPPYMTPSSSCQAPRLPSNEQFAVPGKDMCRIALIKRDSGSGSDMDTAGTSSDCTDTSASHETKYRCPNPTDPFNRLIDTDVHRASGATAAFVYNPDIKDEVVSFHVPIADLSMPGGGVGRCCTPTKDESTNPLVQLSRKGTIEEQSWGTEQGSLDLERMRIDPVMVARLKEMGSAEALSFAIKHDGAQAMPYVIKQALVSSLEGVINNLPQVQQESIVNYALGYLAALLEKFLTKGGGNKFFEHLPNMMHLAATNARQAYIRSQHPIEESGVLPTIQPAHGLPCPPITDRVEVITGGNICDSTLLPSNEFNMDRIDSDIDRLVSHFRNTCDNNTHAQVKRIETSPPSISEETTNDFNRSASSSRSPDSKGTPPPIEKWRTSERMHNRDKPSDDDDDFLSDPTLPKQKTRQAIYGPKLPPPVRTIERCRDNGPRSTDYSPERYSDDGFSSPEIPTAELPKQRRYDRHSVRRSYRRKNEGLTSFNERTSDVKSKKRHSCRDDDRRDGRTFNKNENENSFTRRLENAYVIEDNHVPPPPCPPDPLHCNELRDSRVDVHCEGRDDFTRHTSFDARTTYNDNRAHRRRYRSESELREDFNRNRNKKRVRFKLPEIGSSDEFSDMDEDRDDDTFLTHSSQPKRGRRFSWL